MSALAAGDRRRLSGPASLMLVAPFVLVLIAVFCWPILQLLSASLFDPDFTLRHYEQVLTSEFTLGVFLRTFRVSFLVACFALVVGYPVAALMRSLPPMGAAIVGACVLIPLWTSVLVRSFAWTVLLQRNGVVNEALQGLGITSGPLSFLYNEAAVVIAQGHVMLPFMIMPIYQSLRAIPDELPRAALSLGASRTAVFREVIWPLSRPGVVAGFLMVFIVTLGAFVTPALIGGPRSLMLATLISGEITENLNWPLGAALSAVLLVMVMLLIGLFSRFLRFGRVEM
ncbi:MULTISPECIES: ABC transporter permease [Chelatococcus]|uniref:Mannopine transport system permease protein n=1 Tax=Chelatococcus caeni TaxID=1348468 RepID=A0A840C946_9HYPH|nr:MULTISPECIES: ABC transporter permease [Chelatococcus]ALA20086.1 ABC transporter permease [Chelatococcus sp. CO-6]MBB4018847.1 mannopine transport system permease protein [Chelatococcus caeni]